MSRLEEVLDTALALFAEQGYRATTTAQIEKACGLRPGGGGLYRHVRSKEELLQLAVVRARERRYTPPTGLRSPQEAFVAGVLALTDADLDLWKLIVREPERAGVVNLPGRALGIEPADGVTEPHSGARRLRLLARCAKPSTME